MSVRLPGSFMLTKLEETHSTNDVAKQMASDGAVHGTVVMAQRQTAGRGRQGNQWDSPEGNLFVSYILRPDVPLGQAVQLSFVAAVALADTLSESLPDQFVELKWPNDVLVGGKKIAGILIETEVTGDDLDWLVLGVGVNIAASPDYAVSLKSFGLNMAPEQCLDLLTHKLQFWLETWSHNGFQQVRKAWLKRAHGMGGPLTARLARETLKGTFTGLDEEGALLLELEGSGVVKITDGEVFFD